MQKTKKINFILIALAMICLLCLGFSFNFNMKAQTSENCFDDENTQQELSVSTLAGNFNIRAISRDNENIALDSEPYSGGTAYKVDWSELQSFSISFELDLDAGELPATDPENPVYTLSLSVNYLQGYISSGNFAVGDRISLENVDGTESPDLATLSEFTYTMDIDEGVSDDNASASGWGIYQFVIDINGLEAYSDYYAVEPTYSIAAAPEIDYDVVSSDNSMHDSFQFYLVNFDDYEYIDPNCLTWYVKGTTEDGTTYALCTSDLALANFFDCTAALYDTYDRTGQTFFFNDAEHTGEWQVWCEYRYNNSTYSRPSNTEIVETGSSFDYFMVVYIVIALGVLAVIIIIVTSVVKNKKEKVW